MDCTVKKRPERDLEISYEVVVTISKGNELHSEKTWEKNLTKNGAHLNVTGEDQMAEDIIIFGSKCTG